MKVLKFGGTSVGSAERMRSVASIVAQEQKPVMVVLSAMSGVTNHLVELSNALKAGHLGAARRLLSEIEEKHNNTAKDLLAGNSALLQEALDYVAGTVQLITSSFAMPWSMELEKILLAQGELLSTHLFYFYTRTLDWDSRLLSALSFMRIDEYNEPDLNYIRRQLLSLLEDHPAQVYITQGYICRNAQDQIDNLRRGGSDYTASLVGAAIGAEEIQIWTDIDGMHNNDPRIVPNTFPLRKLSFDEAAELAYFGAKILHPASILPAQRYKIPVRLLNTMQPTAPGTLITDESVERDIKAIAAKDDIIAIKIKSSRMLLAYGFLRRVFEVFERYRTPIDMITTSEVAVSLTIDNDTHLDEIVKELQGFGHVEVDKGQTIICIVGNFVADKPGVGVGIFEALRNIPLRMISYGGSPHNISLLLDTRYKKEALLALNERLFNTEPARI
ncbi:aspartate kinase [Thermonema lapsum]|uniref:Aspartokinase n=1 Tax=Thermonema lapsum TaxID=28195 RepID=A0A846MT43_9BACT|nr:aspartate kinase [Thermonema lapsum]NIK74888.1 aspartate kinase [Thermonema lapsum]